MKWYEQRDSFSSEERILLSLLTMNEDPKKIWLKYSDAFQMSTLNQIKFSMAVESLVSQNIVRMGNQGQGLSLALEEKVEWMLDDRLNEALTELEDDIQIAIEKGDIELAKDLQEILDDKRKK